MALRVLVVDDSSFMRKCLTHILDSDPDIEVVGTASDGQEAIRGVNDLRPDVVLLDVEMPFMDGVEALSRIMAERPTPTVMLSGLEKGAVTNAVELASGGDVICLEKPSGVISYDIEALSAEIISKIKAASQGKPLRRFYRAAPGGTFRRKSPKPPVSRKSIVVIGASTGGPGAIMGVLSQLPEDFPAAILIVQHIGTEMLSSFVGQIQRATKLQTSEAHEGDVVGPGKVYVAPGDHGLTISQVGVVKKVHMSEEGAGDVSLGKIDTAMISVAATYGEGALAILLTGTGCDGVAGMRAIKEAGGTTLAEDESTCVAFGMPGLAVESGSIDVVVPLPHVAAAILAMVRGQAFSTQSVKRSGKHRHV